MTGLRSDIISATTAIIPEPEIGDMMLYDEWYGWEKTEDKKRCMGIFIRRESHDSALIRLITPSEKAFLGAEVGNLAEELVAYRDKVNRLKKKYESRISALIDKELEEFKKEFGQLPQGISVYSVKVMELGNEAPYHLNITTDIDVGL
jgi:hypothetical protein